MPPKFLKILEEVLEIEQEEKKEKYAGSGYRHYPSSASCVKPDGSVAGACLRQLYFRGTKVTPTNVSGFSNVLQRGFGDGIHDWLEKKYKLSSRIAFLGEVSKRVTQEGLENEVSFRMDGVALDRETGEKGYVEFKTQNSYGVVYMQKEGKPKEAAMLQVISCLENDDSLEWASLIYFGRDTGYQVEYHITKTDGDYYVQEIGEAKKKKIRVDGISYPGVVARWKELEEALKTKTEPARDFSVAMNSKGEIVKQRQKNNVVYKTDFQCSYCDWQSYCWDRPDSAEDAKIA